LLPCYAADCFWSLPYQDARKSSHAPNSIESRLKAVDRSLEEALTAAQSSPEAKSLEERMLKYQCVKTHSKTQPKNTLLAFGRCCATSA